MKRREFIATVGLGAVVPIAATLPVQASPEERFAQLLSELTPDQLENFMDRLIEAGELPMGKPDTREDPLPEYLTKWKRLRAEFDEIYPEEGSFLYEEFYRYDSLMTQTQATSVDGILAQIEFAEIEGMDLDYRIKGHEELFENIKSSVRLIGGAACHS